MPSNITRFVLAGALALAATGVRPAGAADAQIARGKYLVEITGCSDCHTAGSFFGKPNLKQFLGGSDVGFAAPGGVFVPPNLTPDKETGLGKWTNEEVVAAITKGERPDKRMLAPAMPWQDFAHLTRTDALAIVAYLKSLPPVSHKVPGPFGEKDTPTVFVMAPIPGDAYAKLPKPPQ